VTSPTEQRNPRTLAIDAVGTSEILQMLNNEDARVAGAVSAVIPELTKAVDAAVEAVRGGGRVHYFGAGTSGRLAVLDAAELLPTFHVPDGLVVAHHAGGMEALLRAVENVEDSEDGGAADAAAVTGQDLVVGLAASGSTPYVAGALKAARAAGATTVLVTSNPDAPLAPLADVVIAADTGPEVIAGSTRLKAGTATKLVLNMLTTAAMIRIGKTYGNLMVDVETGSEKRKDRARRIIGMVTGLESDMADKLLRRAHWNVKAAIVMQRSGLSFVRALSRLRHAHDFVRDAIGEDAEARLKELLAVS